MHSRTTIGDAAISVLKTACAVDKAAISVQYAKLWFDGKLLFDFQTPPPKRPARPDKPELLLPKYMPKRRHKGRQDNIIALLHAIAHIEFNAIDLAWDIMARFGKNMPKEFTDDWVKVAGEETQHFSLICQRMHAYGAAYGDLPAHDGLWKSADDTAHDLKARLAIIPLVLEARGLDVTPAIISRFEKTQDAESAKALTIIYTEEINHVYTGQKWFHYLCNIEKLSPEKTYQNLVKQYFNGSLKPPFNKAARSQAGLHEAFYLPLLSK